ncbi:restriction endonuclease subunit S [Desulfoluna spongiiphila]|uniref:restriction endonuclease subunit S n=1 Tax=Desulfoluna spongiiphila TaxID=419481 RepID=UPI00125186D3|nr:restriction endonuclease subunit S [Desulfoluna spongiiphila]VVS94054.1 restriction endonuclease type i hsds [Desulfoluna spongiiphila]
MHGAEKLITEHIRLWTLAIQKKNGAGRGSSKKIDLYGIKKLRELILELAVRGKLVPQDPGDEPASVLLERIAAEKARLVKEKKIKKPKKLSEINEEEKPFELPNSWEWSRLGLLINLISGQHLKPDEYMENQADGSIPYITGPAEFGDIFPSYSKYTYQYRAVAKKGDILITCKGAGIGKLNIANEKIAISRQLMAIQSINVSSQFLKLIASSLYDYFQNKGVGIAIPGISREDITGTIVGVPPIAEQHRIVTKVDELMALCDQLEQQTEASIAAHSLLVENLLKTLTHSADAAELTANWNRIAEHFTTLFSTEESIDQLKQTILQLAVMGKLSQPIATDSPVTGLLNNILDIQNRKASKKELLIIQNELRKSFINEHDNSVLLKARVFCEFITKGTTPSKPELMEHSDIPFLKVYNIIDNQLDFNYRPIFISKETHNTKLKRSKLFPGDVIMNIVGPPLGKVAIIGNKYPEWNMNQALAVFRPLGGVFNKYLYYILTAKNTLGSVLKEVKGTAGQDNLSLEQCRDLLIPLPSVEEQHRIVAKVDELMAFCDKTKTRLQQAQQTRLHLADAMVEEALN